MIRPQSCTLRSEWCFSALGHVGQGSAQHLPLCLHAWLAFHWESLRVWGRELMSVIWRATDKTKCHFSVYQKWFPPMLNDGSWAWSTLPVGTWWKSGSWYKCKDDAGVERTWGGNLRPDIFTCRLYWYCLSLSWEEKEQVPEVAAVLFERFGNKMCGKCFQIVGKNRASWWLQNYMLAFFELQENNPESFLG